MTAIENDIQRIGPKVWSRRGTKKWDAQMVARIRFLAVYAVTERDPVRQDAMDRARLALKVELQAVAQQKIAGLEAMESRRAETDAKIAALTAEIQAREHALALDKATVEFASS